MTLLEDWLAYLEEPDLFDQHHFEGLALELQTAENLNTAFFSLPGGEGLVQRIIDIRRQADFNGTYLLARNKVIDIDAYKQAERYKDSVADRLRELDDSDAILVQANPISGIEHSDYQYLRSSSKLSLLNVSMTLEDDFIKYCAALPDWVWGLYEVIYMMTTIPEVTRYLLWPIVRYPLNDEPAMKLWLMGHRMDFCQDRSLLIVGGAG